MGTNFAIAAGTIAVIKTVYNDSEQIKPQEKKCNKLIPASIAAAGADAELMIERAKQIAEDEQCEIDETLDVFEDFTANKQYFGENKDGTVYMQNINGGLIQNAKLVYEYENGRESVYVNNELNSYTNYDENGEMLEQVGVMDNKLFSYYGTIAKDGDTPYLAVIDQSYNNEVIYSEKYSTQDTTVTKHVMYDADIKKPRVYQREVAGTNTPAESMRIVYNSDGEISDFEITH